MQETDRAIDSLLDEPKTKALVERYFDDEGAFAASAFDELEPGDPDVVGVSDLLAVTFLDVRVPPGSVRTILGSQAEAISELLRSIPNRDIWEADDGLLDRANDLFRLLHALPGVGPVTAHKLLARKRPRLIPIIDSVIAEALSLPYEDSWTLLRAAMADGDRRTRVEALRPSGISVSTLRLLDVATWITFSRSENARTARGQLGYGAPDPTECLVVPPSAAIEAGQRIRDAVAAVQHGDLDGGRALIAEIDGDAIWAYWQAGGLEWENRHNKDAHLGRKKGVRTDLTAAMEQEVADRDNWTCQYCGVQLVSHGTIKFLNQALGNSFDYGATDKSKHPAALVLRCTWDHVVPVSAGGENEVGNLVATCSVCNYQKGSCTMEELGLLDPRRRRLGDESWNGAQVEV